MRRFFFILFVPSLFLGQVKEELYPPLNTLIKYHNDYTKNHYKVRLTEFKKTPLNYGDIVFIGNSITEGGQDWSKKFGLENVRNRGINGDVTDGVIVRLDEITYFKPKAVFLLIGLNDLWNLHNKKGIPSPDYVGENILKITKIIHTESPATKIYVQTILPTRNDFLMNNIIAVNKIIKLNGKQGIYKVIDLNSIFFDSNGLLIEEMTYDDAHLNEKGYLRWTEYVKEIVLSNID